MTSRRAVATVLHRAAMLLLIVSATARTFLSEKPFRISQLSFSTSPADAPQREVFIDRGELARVTFPILLLSAGALWLLGAALRGRLVVRHAYLAGLVLLFGALSLVSTLFACDKRSGWIVWLEHLSLVAAAFLAMQVFARRRRWGVLLIVLAGFAAGLAAKGIWQEAVERTQRITDFDMYRTERLSQLGWAPGSPEAVRFEVRLRSAGALGYFALANPFASLLVVLLSAAAAVAAAKLVFALRMRKRERPTLRRGEIHLPTLAACLTIPAAAMVAAALVLTRSRGALAAVAVVTIVAAIVVRFRRVLRRHWRKAMLAVAGVFALAAAGVVAFGLIHDRLPSRTMTFRWYYWTGSMAVLAERPMWGVGPGNFPSAYLAHRRPAAAEEAVKNPHNIAVHALAQYGLPGGLCYLAIVGGVLVAACRPSRVGLAAAPGKPKSPKPRRRQRQKIPLRRGGLAVVLQAMIASVAGAIAARAVFAGDVTEVVLMVFETILPAVVVGIMLVLFVWSGRSLSLGATWANPSRIFIACGATAFVLHNMVTYSAWMPGAATAFWVLAGACGGASGAGRPRDLTRFRWPIALIALAAVAAAIVVFWRPVLAKTRHTDAMVRAMAALNHAAALDQAERAAAADPLDPLPAADAAKLVTALCPADEAPRVKTERFCHAYDWARLAVQRDPARASLVELAGRTAWLVADVDEFHDARTWDHLPPAKRFDLLDAAARKKPSASLYRQLGDVAWRLGRKDDARAAWHQAAELEPRGKWVETALGHLTEAVKRSPTEMRIRLHYAERLCSAGRAKDCIEQIRQVEAIDSSLHADSVERLMPDERVELETLRARAEMVMARPRGNRGDL